MHTSESDNTNLTSKLIKLINNIAIQLLDTKEEEDIYRILVDTIKKILPNSYFLITKLQPDDMNFRIVESYGFDKYISIIKTMIGKDPFLIDFPFKDLPDDQLSAFKNRKIYHFKGGIYEIANGALNKAICKTFEKLLGIKDVCAVSFSVRQKFFGSITIYNKTPLNKPGAINSETEMAIEIIANQVSTVIQKIRDEAELKKNEEKLRDQAKQLLKLNKTKDKFFTIIAHDLKSPFNSILGFLKILITEYDTYSNEERLKFINIVNDSAKKIFELLVNLLDWASIQRGHIEVKKEIINLQEFVDESIKLYLINAKSKEITISNNIKDNVFINADRNSMRIVIRNLFSNSIKFTNKGGCVEFNATQNNNNIEILIKDTGVGMSHDMISKLFNFEDSISMTGTNNETGTGLGLILCKELIDKNKGEILVESELGRGTIFKIVVPG